MKNKELVDYIKLQKTKGTPLNVIKSNLRLGGGWSDGDIDEALMEISPEAVEVHGDSPKIAESTTQETSDLSLENNSIPQGYPSQSSGESVDALSTWASEENKNKLNKRALVIGSVFALGGIVLIVIFYLFFPKVGFFVKGKYTESTFLTSIISKSSEIKSSSSRIKLSLSVVPRDADAQPIVVIEPDQKNRKDYQNDYTRSKDASSLLSQLKYRNSYPPSLKALTQSSDYFYQKPSLTDPVSGREYEYRLTDNGRNFTLSITFDTKDAISTIRRSLSHTDGGSSTVINGQTVTFTKDSNPFFFFSPEPPKPFLMEFADMSAFLPSELSADVSFGATTDWSNADWEFNFDANGDFGDLVYKINVDALRKDGDYYFRINNMPSLFLGSLSSVKNRWIKIASQEENNPTGYGNRLLYFANLISDYEETTQKNQEESIRLLQKISEFADKEKLFKFRKSPSPDKIEGRSLKRYELEFRKEAIVPFYERLLDEINSGNYSSYGFMLNDEGLLEYFKSKDFDVMFDYYNKNTFLSLWVDKNGFPVILEYKIRVVPPDTASQLKDRQLELVFNLALNDINKQVNIKSPADFVNLEEIIEDSPLFSARQTGANAAIKSNLASIRAEAEIYYDYSGNFSYGPANRGGNCDTSGTIFVSADVKKSLSAIRSVLSSNNVDKPITCYNTAVSWAVSSPLILSEVEGDYWCVDSTGFSGPIRNSIVSASCI